jgi:hypothetical protein
MRIIVRMRNTLLFLLFSGIAFYSTGQTHELALVASPLDKIENTQIGVMYLRTLGGSSWQLRTIGHLHIDTDKEVRDGKDVAAGGKIGYQLAVGAQSNAYLGRKGRSSVYIATDLYWNSAFVKEQGQNYYGYFYDFGLMPSLGLKTKVSGPLHAFAELRANLNVNLQEYTAPGDEENSDQRLSFESLDHFAIGLSYKL